MKLIFDLSYPAWQYVTVFLPIAVIAYSVCPKKYRRFALIVFDIIFFWSFSGFLIAYLILTSLITFAVGLLLSKTGKRKDLKRKERKKKKQRILLIGILSSLGVLFILKYLDFMGLNIVRLSHLFHGSFSWSLLNLAVPVGISYYTMEEISYLTDVYRENIEAERDFFNLFLFLSFFPKLLEGPITRYDDVRSDLTGGAAVTYAGLTEGYQRILWGLFKKIVIADHLAPAVDILFQGNVLDGSLTLAAAVAFTVQEYMDFSGTIDIVLGSARIFNVRLKENFRQPFFAKNASDFWRRWHITLGTWFRDYIFYPITLSKPMIRFAKRLKEGISAYISKILAPALALFAVWLANGLWHGPKWTYIFYGLYFFVWIEIENILEGPFLFILKKLHLKESSVIVRVFRFIKLFLIVITGEFFFRSDTLEKGWLMFKEIFTNFHWNTLTDNLGLLGMDFWDYWTVAAGLIAVLIVSILKEKEVPIRGNLMKLPLPVRYLFWYACIFAVIIFGAYGSGYDAAGMIYAKF